MVPQSIRLDLHMPHIRWDRLAAVAFCALAHVAIFALLRSAQP